MTFSDFSPLFRQLIGYDRFYGLDDMLGLQRDYPPYDIETLEAGEYRVTMAVAGFSRDDLEVNITDGQRLEIVGNKHHKTKDYSKVKSKSRSVQSYQGIAKRSFRQSFLMADYTEVTSATLKDGLLIIELKREIPEEMKPKKIKIR